MADTPQDTLTKSADEVDEGAEAERIFAELAAEREPEPSDRTAEQPSAASPQQGSDGAEATAGADEAEKPGQTGGGGDAAAAEAASSQGDGDPWATADPKLKAAYEAEVAARAKAEQQFRSREGREAAFQRRITELEQISREKVEPRKPLKDLLQSDELKKLAEEYPDFQKLIDGVSAVAERVDGVEQRVGEVATEAGSAKDLIEERELAKAVPDWIDLAQDDRFMAWVDDQPAKVRSVVRDNWGGITNATAAAEVFEAFRTEIKPAAETGKTDGGAPSKRSRQAASAKAVDVSGPSSASGESDDANVLFDQFAAKKDRERGIR